MVVEEYKLGNTTVRVHDDSYRNKTKEDIERILKKIEKIAANTLCKQTERKIANRNGCKIK